MTLYDLMIASVFFMIAWLIWQNAGFRDRALKLARQHCEQMEVQLLDDTISLLSLRLKRDNRGNFGLARRYQFEFTTTGDRRYQGELHLLGRHLMHMELEPHQI